MAGDERIKNAVLKAIAADLAAGAPGPLSDYLARWPAHRNAVAEAYFAATGAADDAMPPSTFAVEKTTEKTADRTAEETADETADEAAAREDRGDPLSAGPRPDRFGDYDLLRPLGRGGQGEVFLARDRRLGRLVALKLLATGAEFSASAELRFRREAELAARLHHPGLGAVYEAGRHAGRAFLAAAFIPGGSLAEAITAARDRGVENGMIPRTRAGAAALAQRAAKLADALDAAHSGGVLHRDLKPSNILLREDGEFVLVDFGLARAADDEPGAMTATASGELFGTPAYLAPELVAGRGRADRRSDLYAFGATLFEALVGRRAFEGPTREAVFAAILASDPPRPSALNPAVGADLDAVVETLLAREPERRYADAVAVAADLRAAAEGLPVSVRRLSPWGRLLRRAQRRPGAAALTLLSFVLFAAACTLFGLRLADRPKVDAAERAARAAEADRLLEEGSFELHHGRPQTAEQLILRAEAADPDALEPKALAVAAGLALGRPLDEARLAALRTNGGSEFETPLRALAEPDAAAALRLFDAAPEPRTATARYLRGVTLLRLARCDAPAGPAETALRLRALRELDLAVATAPVARRLYHLERLHAASHAGTSERRLDVVAAARPTCDGCLMAGLWTVSCLAGGDAPEAALTAAEDALARHATELAARPSLRAALLTNRMRLMTRLGRTAEALIATREFDSLFPERPEGALLRAEAALAARRGDEAERELAPLAARPPDAADLRFELLRLSAAVDQLAGRTAAAVAKYREATVLAPHEPAAWRALVPLLLGSDPEAALAAARRATEIDPDDAAAWAYRAALATDDREAETACARAEAAPAHRPRPNFLGAESGRRAEQRGAFSAARAAYRRAFAQGFEPARGALAALEVALGRSSAAAELAREGEHLRPEDPYPKLAAALAACEQGEFDRAVTLAEEATTAARRSGRPEPEAAVLLAREARRLAASVDEDDPVDSARAVDAARAAARGPRRGETLARWRLALELDAEDARDAGRRPSTERMALAATDVLRAHGPEDPAAAAFARGLLETIVAEAEAVVGPDAARTAALRRLRFCRAHDALAFASDPARLDALPPAEHVAWRRLVDRFSAAEAARSAALIAALGGPLYGEP